MLDELPRLHPSLELLCAEKVIVDPIALARARAPGGGRYRQLETVEALHKAPDQRALARAGASIRWLRERSGAVELLAGAGRAPGRVAVVMGGESTHQRDAIKANCRNSPGPQVEVERHRGWWTVKGRPQSSVIADLRRVFGTFHIRPRHSKRRSCGRDSAAAAPSDVTLAIR